MNIRQSLICFLLFSLGDRNTGVADAEVLQHPGTEGGNITVECIFTFSGKKKIFCRNECEDGDILIATDDITAQRGRYSIKYIEGTFPLFSTLLYVSITKLNKSDSGRYRCGLHRSFIVSPSYTEIEIRVKEAPTTSKPNWTLKPFPSSVPTASTPSSASTLTTTLTTSAAGPGVLLYVGVTLVILVIILSATVLVFCRKRVSKAKEPPEENEYANVTEANRVNKQIRKEDGQSRAPPVEMAMFYTNAEPNGVETTGVYNFITAASSQKEAEDASRELTYSQVDFSGATAVLTHSAARGEADNVVYSVPQVTASGSHAEDASPPLYSTVTLH